jgi:hypothetical protein
VVWLVSHLKATWPPNANLTQPPQWCVPRAVGTQRQQFKTGILEAGRAKRLAKLPGWDWQPRAGKWEEGFRHIVEYAKKDGHACPPNRYVSEDGYRLGAWVQQKRHQRDRGELDPTRVRQLEKLEGWAWSTREASWEEGFRHLVDTVRASRDQSILTSLPPGPKDPLALTPDPRAAQRHPPRASPHP